MKSKRNKRIPQYANGFMGGLNKAAGGINKGFGAAGDAAGLLGILGQSQDSNLQTTSEMQTGPVSYEKFTAPTMAEVKSENKTRGVKDTLGAAAAGAKLGAAAGPIGAAVGGVVGLIGGGIKSIFGAKKRRKEAVEKQRIADETNSINFSEGHSKIIADEYYGDQEYQPTDVATFANGKMPIRYNSKHTVNGKYNALIANGELIKRANGGGIEEVTSGSSAHTDDVPASINPKDSILSAKNINPTTGNTFAEDGKKLSNIEKRAMRNKERNTSIISENTAKLNQAYIDRSWNNLLQIQNASNQAAGRYKDGKSPLTNAGENMSGAGLEWIGNMFDNFREGIQRDSQRLRGAVPTVSEDRQGRRSVQYSTPAQSAPVDGYSYPSTQTTFQTQNIPPYIIPGSQQRSVVGQVPAQSSTTPVTKPIITRSSQSQVSAPVAQPAAFAGNVPNNLLPKATSTSFKPQAASKPTTMGWTPQTSMPQTNGDFNMNGALDSLGEGLGSLTELSPVISNLLRSSRKEKQVTPEQLYTGNPYESLIVSKASKMRYNSKPEEREAREAEQRARYNTRQINSAGGINRAFDIATALNTRRAMGDIQAKKQNANNQYQQNAMNLMNQLGAQRSAGISQAKQQALDINMRNKAASENAKSTAFSQLSQYSQNKTQMKAQQKRDARLEKIYEAWAKNYMPANLI